MHQYRLRMGLDPSRRRLLLSSQDGEFDAALGRYASGGERRCEVVSDSSRSLMPMLCEAVCHG